MPAVLALIVIVPKPALRLELSVMLPAAERRMMPPNPVPMDPAIVVVSAAFGSVMLTFRPYAW